MTTPLTQRPLSLPELTLMPPDFPLNWREGYIEQVCRLMNDEYSCLEAECMALETMIQRYLGQVQTIVCVFPERRYGRGEWLEVRT